MAHFVGLDVSVQETSVCVVDDVGKVLCERKVRTEPEDIAVLLTSIGGDYVRIAIEPGPLSQWLVGVDFSRDREAAVRWASFRPIYSAPSLSL